MKVIQKLYDRLAESKYVKYNDFRCQDALNQNGALEGIALYRFNSAEKLGNSLLKDRASLKEKSWKVLSVVGFAVLLHKIGSAFNSKAHLRDQALVKYEQILKKLPGYFNQHNHILEENDLANAKYTELYQRFQGEHKDLDMQPFLDLDRQYWKALSGNEDLVRIEWKIRDFFQDEQTSDAYFEAIKINLKARKYHDCLANPLANEEIAKAIPEIQEYNQILAQLDQPKN